MGRGRAGFAALVMTAACLTAGQVAAAPAPPAQPVSRASDCGDVRILGIAGSGEQRTGAKYGTTIDHLLSFVTDPLVRSGYRVSRAPVVYHPESAEIVDVARLIAQGHDAPFMHGMRRGVNLATEAIRSRVKACPREIQVVAGYSQGAMVAIEALRRSGKRTSTSSVASHVAAVALVGNPYSHPTDASIGYGTAPPDHEGAFYERVLRGRLGDPPQLDRAWVGHVYEACNKDDVVCDFSYPVLRSGQEIHRMYTHDTEDLLKELAEVVRVHVERVPRDAVRVTTTIQGQPFETRLDAGMTTTRGNRLRWRLGSGSLPPGLTLSRDGWIRGTPVRPGAYTVKALASHPTIAPGVDAQVKVRITISANTSSVPWRVIDTTSQGMCGIRADDSAWCWGSLHMPTCPTDAQGVCQPHSRPAAMAGTWRALEPAGNGGCGLQTDGSGWCWGENDEGVVGDGTRRVRDEPVRLPGLWSSIDIDPYASNACGIRTDGTGWCWGDNSYGQVGDGTRTDRLRPTQLPGTWATLNASAETTCGVRTDGSGWCWGDNSEGGVDPNLPYRPVTSPHQIAGDWSELLPGCGLRTDGSIWCWSDLGDYLTAPDGTPYDDEGPHRVPGGPWTALWVDDDSACAIATDSSASCWGRRSGDGTLELRPEPFRLPGSGWEEFSIEYPATCGHRTDGTAWCWGENEYGEVGNGTQEPVLTPYQLPGTAWVDVVAGRSSCGVQSDGTGWCWGGTYVGDGTPSLRLVPTLVE